MSKSGKYNNAWDIVIQYNIFLLSQQVVTISPCLESPDGCKYKIIEPTVAYLVNNNGRYV